MFQRLHLRQEPYLDALSETEIQMFTRLNQALE